MNNEIHVWTVSLDSPAKESEQLGALSPDERVRAGRFLAEHNRRRFVGCRAALRRILAGLLDQNPSEIGFEYSPNGKPLVANSKHIQFNVSHSEDIALIAVARGRAVGVDLEKVRPDFATDAVAERFFSPLEREMLRSVPAESRLEAFARCWTRKEAFVKAIGEGLSYQLDRFDVSLKPNEPARLLSVGGDQNAALRWSLRDLSVASGYVAALAVEGKAEQIVERADLPN